MKRKIQIIILISFIGCFFYGCEDWFKDEEVEEYITVIVRVKGKLTLKNSDGDVINLPESFDYGTIQIEIGKAGNLGNRFMEYIDETGSFHTEQVILKVYKEQPVEAIAYAIEVPDTYTQIRGVGKLTWAELSSKVDFGESYTMCFYCNPILQLK